MAVFRSNIYIKAGPATVSIPLSPRPKIIMNMIRTIKLLLKNPKIPPSKEKLPMTVIVLRTPYLSAKNPQRNVPNMFAIELIVRQ